MAMVDKEGDVGRDEEMGMSSTTANTAEWSIIPLKSVKSESVPKTIQTMLLQSTPRIRSDLETTAISQQTSCLTASTFNISVINASYMIMALRYSPEPEIVIQSDRPTVQPQLEEPEFQLHGSPILDHLTISSLTMPDSTQ